MLRITLRKEKIKIKDIIETIKQQKMEMWLEQIIGAKG